jgi:hypothetical protein
MAGNLGKQNDIECLVSVSRTQSNGIDYWKESVVKRHDFVAKWMGDSDFVLSTVGESRRLFVLRRSKLLDRFLAVRCFSNQLHVRLSVYQCRHPLSQKRMVIDLRNCLKRDILRDDS